ncbi:MAG: hypothetical protein MJ231_05980 [bacterium]|nr:hypothetical protein [bacterium]
MSTNGCGIVSLIPIKSKKTFTRLGVEASFSYPSPSWLQYRTPSSESQQTSTSIISGLALIISITSLAEFCL